MTTQPYIYRVTDIERIVDGDTYWLRLDVGFRANHLTHLRLLGVDTPEANVSDPREREAAHLATDTAETWLRSPGELWVQTRKDPDSFGRWLGHLWRNNPNGTTTHLNEHLVDAGLATTWPTRWRDVWLTDDTA